jgi:acid phosphatase
VTKNLFRLFFPATLTLVAGLLQAEPANLGQLKQEVVAYIDSGRYEQEIKEVAGQVIGYLEERAKASTRGSASVPKLAIVFDLDETMLSNLPEMRALDFGYVPAEWTKWVAKGEAPVIQPVKEIYQAARRLGISVLFLSGRKEIDRAGTEKNLRAVGVGEYAALVLKPDGSQASNADFKTAERAKFEQAGWKLIANVGDQASDLAGGHAERTFKLPDPFYLAP